MPAVADHRAATHERGHTAFCCDITTMLEPCGKQMVTLCVEDDPHDLDPGIDDFRNEPLWSPERPTLLDTTIRLLRGNEVIDQLESYTALRSINVLRHRFMLNVLT